MTPGAARLRWVIASTAIAVVCGVAPIGCGGTPTDDDVAVDEQALIVADLPVAGTCVTSGPGTENAIANVTPVSFRVQVFKTLVRVWVPEVSPGAEFEPLGGRFSGRNEYRTGDGPPSQPGIATVNYRYWKLPHATATDPVIELAIDDGPPVTYAGRRVRAHEYQIVLRFDAATGHESLYVSMRAEDRYREWGGQATDTRFPFVTCQAAIDSLL
jgi:hypothetical protein